MINARQSKQNWSIGSIVKVGFMTLKVIGCRAIVDGMPDIYDLESLDGTKRYEFIPHNGLHRIHDEPPFWSDFEAAIAHDPTS